MATYLESVIEDFKKKLPFTGTNGLVIVDLRLSENKKEVLVIYDDDSISKMPAKLFLMAAML